MVRGWAVIGKGEQYVAVGTARALCALRSTAPPIHGTVAGHGQKVSMDVPLNEFTAFLKDGVILPLELNKTIAGARAVTREALACLFCGPAPCPAFNMRVLCRCQALALRTTRGT